MATPYSYFPATYAPFQQVYPQMQQPQQMLQQPVQQAIQQNQPQQIQNGGFISVRSRIEAQNYPIAPGNSVTFKDETAPYVYVKTMGFSSLDRPVFEAFRLVKEDAPLQVEEMGRGRASEENNIDLSIYVTKSEIEPILARIEALEQEKKKVNKKKEAESDV